MVASKPAAMRESPHNGVGAAQAIEPLGGQVCRHDLEASNGLAGVSDADDAVHVCPAVDHIRGFFI